MSQSFLGGAGGGAIRQINTLKCFLWQETKIPIYNLMVHIFPLSP